MSSQHFRAGVVIVVRHPDGRRVLAFERADAPGAGSCRRAGWRQGEEPIAGAWRELLEETGLGEADVVARAEYPEWVAYEWPEDVIREHGRDGRRRGQVHKWFLFDALRADIAPTPDGSEFVAWHWVDPEWLVDHVVDWRRPAYERVLGYPVSDLFTRRRREAPARPGAAGRPAAAAHARRCRRPGPPRRPGQAAAPSGRAGPPDQRDLLGAARHRQDHAGAGRRRHARSGSSSR